MGRQFTGISRFSLYFDNDGMVTKFAMVVALAHISHHAEVEIINSITCGNWEFKNVHGVATNTNLTLITVQMTDTDNR